MKNIPAIISELVHTANTLHKASSDEIYWLIDRAILAIREMRRRCVQMGLSPCKSSSLQGVAKCLSDGIRDDAEIATALLEAAQTLRGLYIQLREKLSEFGLRDFDLGLARG